MMRTLLVLSLLLSSVAAGGGEKEDYSFLYAFLAGRYHLVGKRIDSDETYLGRVTLISKKGHLEVIRQIDGQTVRGVGRIESALGPDQAHVLRVRFQQNEQNFEATYLWRADLDNYARLSGYLYIPGRQTRSPGLEALFTDHGD